MFFDKDDSSLVKVNIIDDKNPAETTCVEISRDYYERILSGQSTIRKEYDDEGNLQLFFDEIVEAESKDSLNTLNKVINNTTNLHSISLDNDDYMLITTSNFPDDVNVQESSLDNKPTEGDEEIKEKEYIISEYPSDGDYYVVIIEDANGQSILEKAGQIGDTIMLDLCGNEISYLISGPNDDGTIRQTNVYIDQSENDVPETEHQDQQITSETDIPNSNAIPDAEDANQEEYVISEETVFINNSTKQMVRLSDKNHNVFDTKYGIKGGTVKLQLTDNAFEYAIQGPMESGEPIVITFAINKVIEDADNEEPEQQHIVEDPAVQWCPTDVSNEDYAVIRDAARQIATALENTNDLPMIQPYSEELGSRSAYQDVVNLVERYKSHIEERQADLQLLRRHSKIYMPAKANARKLTKLELIKNEAAAQICRYIPSLLFHKKRLHKYVQAVIERSGLSFVREELSDENRPFTGPATVAEEGPGNIMAVPAISATRTLPQSSSVASVGNYISGEMDRDNNFNQPFSFGKRDLQLTINEETAIRNAAERLQDELYQYPIVMSSTDCKLVDDLQGLQAALLSGDNDEVERAHAYMRKESALSGRLTSLPRRTMLSPYDVAVNEAAYHLVRNNIGLLTHEKTLLDLARRAVRASGFSFRQNAMGDKKEYNHNGNMWLSGQDNVPELDLSCAVHVLSDPLEDGPSHLLSFVPAIEETLIALDSGYYEDDDDEQVYRPREFKERELLGNVNLECEAERNILNECVIYSHTGTDNLKKVRILDLQHCSFTSIMPIDINQCCNLVELNLANNAISYLPRCLFLPNLNKINLRNNRFVTVPLLEQFAKLVSLELDEKVARKLNKESLTFFCPDLRNINNRKFEGVISDEFNDTFTTAKTHIEVMIQNRWEEDLAMFFKNGVTKSESQKVIETLVIGVRGRRVINECKFANFKDLIARRVAEGFLESKITDDYDDEEYKEKISEEVNSDDEEEIHEENMHPRSMYQRKNEFDNQTVEKGQILLNDEPLDRLTNVVGQALRCGKTVVYSVMRTAARQPGGDLIPVGGGGDSNQNSNYLLSSAAAAAAVKKHIGDGYGSSLVTGDDKDREPTIKTRPGPASFKKRKYGIEQAISDTDNDMDIQQLIDTVMDRVEMFNNHVKKRVGRPKSHKDEKPTKIRRTVAQDSSVNDEMFKAPKTLYQDDEIGLIEYDILDQMSKNTEKLTPGQITQRVEEIIEACKQPVTPQQLRKTLGLSVRGRPSAFITQASNRTYVKHNQEVPEPTYQNTKKTAEWTLDPGYDTNFDTDRIDTSAALTRVINQTTRYIVDETSESRSNDFPTLDVLPDKVVREIPAIVTAVTPLLNELAIINEIKKLKPKAIVPPPKPLGELVVMPMSTMFNPVRDPNSTASTSQKIPDYDPLHFIRCHALDNNPQDCTTKVWRCAFEPLVTNPYQETTSTVATCGGECVCLIDCCTGKVKKRFKSKEEEFYCVAWTTVEIAPGHQINILAAGGKSKDIRLLHPEHMVCYAEMKGHDNDIACMTFHPRYPTVLFTGDALANILVWDIGVPSAVDYTTKYQLLTRLVCPRAHLNPVLNLVVMPSHDVLAAGCEDGLFIWLFPDFRKTEPMEKRSPDFELQVATHQEPCFDGLARLSENTMLVKSVEEGEIFTINFVQILQHYKARKFDDQNRVVADVIGWLRWQITDEIFINVTAQQNRSSVLCGDNEGTIWLYDMTKEMADEQSNKKFKAKPAKVLDWPECNVDNTDKKTVAVKNPIVNCVEMSSDGKFLVAVTDNNLVCIWSVVDVPGGGSA